MLRLEQMVPNPGKLSARQRAAASEAAARRSAFESTRLSVREQVAVAYADVQALDARIAVMARIAELLRDIEGVVEARVRADLVPQSALLRVQVEADRVESDTATLALRRPSLMAALAAATGLTLDSDADVDPLPESAAPALPDRAALTARALDHPTVQVALARRAVASARVDEAGWMWVPDLMFGVEYMAMDRMDGAMSDAGRHGIGFMAGITIPWQVHVNAARGDRARAEELAAGHLVQQQRLELAARLETQMYAHEDANRLVELYAETVLPKARQTLELVRADFVTDRATLTDVLDAERSLLAAELSLIGARADVRKARARISALAARDLELIE
jgi:outer membrane protein, heavy metal efflux system